MIIVIINTQEQEVFDFYHYHISLVLEDGHLNINKKIIFALYFYEKQYLTSDGEIEAIESYNDLNDNSQADMIYELCAIFIHDGAAGDSPYYAYTKDFESGEWIRFNDSQVHKMPKNELYCLNPKPHHKNVMTAAPPAPKDKNKHMQEYQNKN